MTEVITGAKAVYEESRLDRFPRPLLFLIFFSLTRLHKRIFERPEVVMRVERLHVAIKALLMPYVWLSFFFGVLAFEDLFITAQHVLAHGIPQECGENPTDCKNLPFALAFMSLCSPVAVVLCYFVCLVHTMQHGARCKWGPMTYGHDMATQISSLPVVYALLSFKSVVSMWQAMADPKNKLEQRFDINYSVADCYEAWALYCFGRICMLYLQNAASWETNEARNLMTPLQKLLLQGLLSFCLIQLCAAAYSLIIETFESQGICRVHPSLCELEKYLTGAVFGLSCLAIMNMVVFETSLGEYVHGLRPKFKFIYAKCLLSITCMQQALLGFLAPWLNLKDSPSKLLYASLVCIECLLLSMVNWRAWNPNSGWHEKVLVNPRASLRIARLELRTRTSLASAASVDPLASA